MNLKNIKDKILEKQENNKKLKINFPKNKTSIFISFFYILISIFSINEYFKANSDFTFIIVIILISWFFIFFYLYFLKNNENKTKIIYFLIINFLSLIFSNLSFINFLIFNFAFSLILIIFFILKNIYKNINLKNSEIKNNYEKKYFIEIFIKFFSKLLNKSKDNFFEINKEIKQDLKNIIQIENSIKKSSQNYKKNSEEKWFKISFVSKSAKEKFIEEYNSKIKYKTTKFITAIIFWLLFFPIVINEWIFISIFSSFVWSFFYTYFLNFLAKDIPNNFISKFFSRFYININNLEWIIDDKVIVFEKNHIANWVLKDNKLLEYYTSENFEYIKIPWYIKRKNHKEKLVDYFLSLEKNDENIEFTVKNLILNINNIKNWIFNSVKIDSDFQKLNNIIEENIFFLEKIKILFNKYEIYNEESIEKYKTWIKKCSILPILELKTILEKQISEIATNYIEIKNNENQQIELLKNRLKLRENIIKNQIILLDKKINDIFNNNLKINKNNLSKIELIKKILFLLILTLIPIFLRLNIDTILYDIQKLYNTNDFGLIRYNHETHLFLCLIITILCLIINIFKKIWSYLVPIYTIINWLIISTISYIDIFPIENALYILTIYINFIIIYIFLKLKKLKKFFIIFLYTIILPFIIFFTLKTENLEYVKYLFIFLSLFFIFSIFWNFYYIKNIAKNNYVDKYEKIFFSYIIYINIILIYIYNKFLYSELLRLWII